MAKASNRAIRPVDLARPYGLTAQAIRNYESRGAIPPAERSETGYRRYTERHAVALGAYLALIPAYGYTAAAEIMRAAHEGDRNTVFDVIDRGHVQLLRDRETLDSVEAAVGLLTAGPAATPARPAPISALAHRLGVRPATLRKWERAGILAPERDRATRYRVYSAEDVRDADLAHLLRRGGYLLSHIATVVRHVRDAGGPAPLAASLSDWRQRLTTRGRAMLTAAARLDSYLTLLDES